MKMIRPYGQSVVEENDGIEDKIRQMLLDDKEGKIKTLQDIYSFILNKPELILNFAISTLDKIILKPKQDKEKKKSKLCHNDIHAIRKGIGQALWTKLSNDKIKQALHKELSDENKITKKLKELEELWNRKVKPYEITSDDKKKHKFYGRYFTRFTDKSTKLEQLNPEQIANNIIEHLFQHEYRLGCPDSTTDKKHSHGKIYNIAEAISKSIIKMPNERKYLYTNEDIETYFEKVNCDFAKEICCKYHCESGDKKLTFEIIMPILHANYKPVFGEVTIQEAKEKDNALLAVHMAVKEFYKALVRVKYDYKSKVDMLLPKNNQELEAKLTQKHDNQDINSDIRLGKILHYTNMQKKSGSSSTFDINSTDITKSSYWTSEGQKEIKRSEAFIKTWFNFIAFASHSLTYLTESQKLKGYYANNTEQRQDILTSDGLKKAIEYFEDKDFRKKLSVMFGQNHVFTKNNENTNTALFYFLQKGLGNLRNNVFHFKPDFENLILKPINANPNGKEPKDLLMQQYQSDFHLYCKTLCDNDQDNSKNILKNSLEAIKAGEYLNKGRLKAYCEKVSQFWGISKPAYLPKFKAVFNRADAISKGEERDKQFVNAIPERSALKTELFDCQYTLLKFLYETDFQNWFKEKFEKSHGRWIFSVQQRSDKETSHLNKDNPDVQAKNKVFAQKYDDLQKFLDALLTAHARNGSLVNGYDVDEQKQKDASNYVNDFIQDIMVFAFNEYVGDVNNGVNYIGVLEKEKSGKVSDFQDEWFDTISSKQFETWQHNLYLLFHLVPAGMVSELRNQLEKCSILLNKSVAKAKPVDPLEVKQENNYEKIIQLCLLYQTTCDLKFDGSSGYKIANEIKPIFYDLPSDYDIIFPANDSSNDKQTAQHRHVREMVRFGVGNYLKETNKISHSKIIAWQTYSQEPEKIKKWHEKIAELHQKWVDSKQKGKPEFKQNEAQEYKKLLKDINDYKELDNQVRLVDYRKIHKLVMQILGRLVGFSFMYERDLYFLTLAYFYNNNFDNEKKKGFFKKCEKRKDKFFKDGQIITALSDLKCPHPKEESRCEDCLPDNIPPHIQDILKHCEIRNYFAHFNMLINENQFRLLKYINQARTLMDYDRKLKNAVAKSMIGLCKKENIDIKFEIKPNYDNQSHNLNVKDIQSRTTKPHLGGAKIGEKDGEIIEKLHGENYITMVEALFGVPKPS